MMQRIFILFLFLSNTGLAADNPAFDDPQSIFFAARTGKLDQVQKLIDTNPDLLDVQDAVKRTPLLYAAKAGHVKVVEYLLDKGTKAVYSFDGYGHTPVHWAAMYAKLNVLKLFAERRIDLNCRDEEGRAPLHYTVGNVFSNVVPHEATVELLISLGVDVNAQDKAGMTALQMGMLVTGHAKAVETLLTKSDKLNVNFQDKVGSTPLHKAAAWGRDDLIPLLLARGADKTIKRNDGKTALEVAKECVIPAKRADVVRALETQ